MTERAHPADAVPVVFETRPEHYQHRKLAVDGAIATLGADLDAAFRARRALRRLQAERLRPRDEPPRSDDRQVTSVWIDLNR